MGEVLQQHWDETIEMGKSPGEVPSPPEKMGKTYGLTPREKDFTKKSFRCCIQVEVRDEADSAVVAKELNRYLIDQSGFDVQVIEARHVGGRWWDFLIEYYVHLAKVRAFLIAHEIVLDVRAKPSVDIGQVA